jgi:hypothetical protein
MKFEFTDTKGRRYQFELDAEPNITGAHIEIIVWKSPIYSGAVTVRSIVDGKVKWFEPDDQWQVSLEARHYIDKIIKNKAFL